MDDKADDAGGSGPQPARMFLTAEEVGQQLGLRRSRVYELAAAGLLPVVRLGKRMLFPRRGLDDLADAAVAQVKDGVLNGTTAALVPSQAHARHRRSA